MQTDVGTAGRFFTASAPCFRPNAGLEPMPNWPLVRSVRLLALLSSSVVSSSVGFPICLPEGRPDLFHIFFFRASGDDYRGWRMTRSNRPRDFVLVVGNLPAGWAVEAEHSRTCCAKGDISSLPKTENTLPGTARMAPDTVPICSWKRRKVQGFMYHIQPKSSRRLADALGLGPLLVGPGE
jgi:hypothetical protein